MSVNIAGNYFPENPFSSFVPDVKMFKCFKMRSFHGKFLFREHEE